MVGQTPVLRILENVCPHIFNLEHRRCDPHHPQFRFPEGNTRLTQVASREGPAPVGQGRPVVAGCRTSPVTLLQPVPASDCRWSRSNTVDGPRGRRGSGIGCRTTTGGGHLSQPDTPFQNIFMEPTHPPTAGRSNCRAGWSIRVGRLRAQQSLLLATTPPSAAPSTGTATSFPR